MKHTCSRWIPVLALIAAVPATIMPQSAAHAGEATVVESDATDEASERTTLERFRGSFVSLRNSASAISFDKSAELTYNPDWVIGVNMGVRYWFDEVVSVGGSVGFQHEVTEADSTTLNNETIWTDVTLDLRAQNWATIPVVDINLSSALAVNLPTSLPSRYQTLFFGLSASMGFSKTFAEVLEGLTLSYNIRLWKGFHDFTTSERETPLISGCRLSAAGCDSHLNSGVRNASWRLNHYVGLNLGLTSWLSFSAGFGAVTAGLYDAKDDDDRVNYTALEQVSARHVLLYDIGFGITPTKGISVALGATTGNPELAPDSSRYAPFFNRFTSLYLDVRFDVPTLVGALIQ